MSFFETLNDRRIEFARHFRRRYRSLLILCVVSLMLAVISHNPFVGTTPLYKEGDIPIQSIKATQHLRAIDDEQTNRRRESAVASVHDVYDFDSQRLEDSLSSLSELIALASQGVRNRNLAEQKLRVALSDNEWNLLTQIPLSTRLAKAYEEFLKSLRRPWIVTSVPSTTVSIRDITSGEEIVVTRFLLEAQSFTKSQILLELESFVARHRLTRTFPRASRKIGVDLISKILTENLVFNKVETNQRREEVLRSIEPVWAEVESGEILAREGERLDKRQVLLIQAQRDLHQGKFNWASTLGFAVIFFLLANVFYVVGRRNFRKFRLSMRDQLVMGSFLVLSVALIAGLKHLFNAAKLHSTVGQALIFLLPLGFSGMTLRLFTSMEIATFFLILFSVAVGWLMNDPFFSIIALCSGLAGAARMRRIQQRFDIFKAGLVAGFVAALMAIAGSAMGAVHSYPVTLTWLEWILIPAFSFSAGLLSAGLVLGIQPALEQLGYTTDLRLMELSRTDHPLLRDLILKAPGTYFHSFTVSQLAEKAAEAIQANSLFARVASLYHDIGKTKKPQYFIENIKGENKHDKLAPTMSALIISNHVRDGIELGIEHQLPPSIIEIIPQHHGTSLISFFYEKAKKGAEGEEVHEGDFRYPGPKPQTKEAAIILMADAVEATAKTLSNATEDQLTQMVHKTIQRFFLDGQLDECDLSLKDLSAIGIAFVQVLLGVYHHRIDYPHLKGRTDEPTVTLPKLKPL